MGSRQSQPVVVNDTSSQAPTNLGQSHVDPPRPTESPLNPTPASSGILSYFYNPTKPSVTHHHLHPSSIEIICVTKYLNHLGLPIELVPRVLDFAEYWTSCRRMNNKQILVDSIRHRGHLPGGEGPWSAGQTDEITTSSRVNRDGGLKCTRGNVWYLISSPIGCISPLKSNQEITPIKSNECNESNSIRKPQESYDNVWIRRCIIETLSKDQGWSTSSTEHYGTYEQSYSWFEISLLRDDKEVEGSRHSIQHNIVAGQYYKSHVNILEFDHPTLKLAKPGDKIVLWVRAQYQGWQNWVKEGAITIFTSPYPPSS
ncbi:uncharacterized protein I206_102056 [Kwoniella pini CBS 10737]|uniref:Uncharacterized protein n=1 Tax=Kwoniella pini CBS 10737 TaxID=1296096 RepID=A0A1B9HUY0_9TREE|nr:uncharacterized protein I206_06851 [Kwoniella pini CBS 10737]OCF47077.1 hypothetical protein I206_06851 [Kwoniella pini CBS 10737]